MEKLMQRKKSQTIKKSEQKSKTSIGTVGPARDEKALLFPVTVIRADSNIRERLENIEELAQSIKENGLLQPLVVAKVADGWTIVAGHRRFAALKLLGAKMIPVRLTNADPSRLGVLRLVENLIS